jgi:hypothetical protein
LDDRIIADFTEPDTLINFLYMFGGPLTKRLRFSKEVLSRFPKPLVEESSMFATLLGSLE